MNKNIKFLGMVMLAGAAITSCSNNDDVLGNADNDLATSNGICFTQASQKGDVATRSFNATKNALESFSVDILPVDGYGNPSDTFLGKDITFTMGTDGVYASNPQYYWPTDGSLDIYAISPVVATTRKESTRVINSENTGVLTSPRVVTNWDGTIDLMAAMRVEFYESDRFDGAVPLTFSHITSDVTAKFKAADETKDLTYVVKSLVMTAPNSGEVAFYNGAHGDEDSKYQWTIDATTTGTYNFFKTQTSSLQFTNGYTDEAKDDYFILPTTEGTLTFTVEYEVYQSGQKILDFTDTHKKTVTVENPNLEMGKRYTYVLALPASEADPITFTVNKVDFTENVDKDVNVPAE